MDFFQIGEFFRFYRTAVTKYQLHSTFVFELAYAVLEDQRRFYAFRDVEALRQKMLASAVAVNVADYGTGGVGEATKQRTVRSIVRQAGSSVWQGQLLFRLANHLRPTTMLELGSSVGISAMYLASAVREARFLTLEGSPELAHVARMNLEWLGLSQNVEVREGTFEQQLAPALQDLKKLDFVFFDGNHRPEPTLQYFETCLAFAHEKTVFVFDDVHGSPGMSHAWEQIKKHPRVRLSLDFFEISLVFFDPDFREKQHFNIVPARWKPWMFF
jgi:predicted O-methyltransferase YrrM